MFRYIKVNQKGLILVLLPLIFELIFVAVLAQRLATTANEFDKLAFSQRALYKLLSKSQEILASTFVIASYKTIDPQKFINSADRMIKVFSQSGFTGDPEIDSKPEMRELFEDVDTNRRMILAMAKRIKANAGQSPTEYLTNKDRDEMVMTCLTFRSLFDRVKGFANRADLEESIELNRMSTQVTAFLITGFAISCGLSVLVAYVFTFDIVNRLRIISQNAYLVAAGRESREPQQGTDEIAELDRSLHKTSLQLQAFRKKELAILNNAADVVCSLDRQLRFVVASQSAEKIWGYSSEDLVGRSLISILASDTADDAPTNFESVAKSKQTSEIGTVIKCKNGSLKDSLWRVNWSDEAQEYVCVVHDVTEIKKIERLKQAFFSMVSHDLRAPLTSININLANMTSGHYGQIPDGAEKIVNNAVVSTERLTALVNDLLELDKLDSGKLTLELECISLREVCESSIANVESMATNVGVEIKGPSGDAAVMADEKRLVQAVTNLISNAIKFSPVDAKVIVQIRRHDDQVEIAVTDQGPGIPAEQQPLLFDKFSQGSAVSNIAVKSTGLGLAIVKSIAKAHSGEVGVTSEPGDGATFWIRLTEFTDDDGAA